MIPLLLVSQIAVAQSPLISLQTVRVGDAGNAADSTGFGAVGYEYEIGKYEVTIGQYATFLNSVASAATNNYIINLWNSNMAADLNIAGISRSGSGTLASPYSYSTIGGSNRPIAYVSWFDAARFANWMNNGATNGASTETGAYMLNGATNGNTVTRNEGSLWHLPSENEWYKAAYYKGGGTNAGYWLYPTKSSLVPSNNIGGLTNQANYKYAKFDQSLGQTFHIFAVTVSSVYSTDQNYLTSVGAFSNSSSAYGTFDQGGNVKEWTESAFGLDRYVMRGGSWESSGATNLSSARVENHTASWEFASYGFRVATVPEPSTYALLLLAGAGAALMARCRAKRG